MALAAQPLPAFACAVTGVQAYQASSPEVATAMELGVVNRLGPAYPPLPPLETASGTVNAPIPCVLLKAIGYVESSWRQAMGSVAVGQTGPVKQSPSCGYGIMQITSGMRNPGELAADVQQRIAADYRYNIGWGARVLTEKWNAMDFFGAVVGDRDPAVAENWYYAVWAYNNFAFRNHPSNPDYPADRPQFNGTQSRLNYPYQELVWGLAANPPREGARPLWDPVALTLPPREQIGEKPGPIPEPSPSHGSVCRTLYGDPGGLDVAVSADAAPVTRTFVLGGTAASAAWQAVQPPEAWVRVSPVSGAALPAQVTVTVNPRGLRVGVHRAVVNFTGAGGYTAFTFPVTLVVESSVRWFFPWVPWRER